MRRYWGLVEGGQGRYVYILICIKKNILIVGKAVGSQAVMGGKGVVRMGIAQGKTITYIWVKISNRKKD